jgi:hypothetical protein
MYDERYKKVQGSSGLYKNLATGVVINTNEEEIRLARQRKKISLEEKENKLKLKSEVASLKDEISELKDLIRGLVGKQNGI